VAAATNQSVSNDSKTTIMLAAKKKQIEIHNKLLFPNINKENSHQAQPKLRLADLSHNIASSFENNNIVGAGGGLTSNNNNSDSVGSLRIMGDGSVGGGVSNIRKPAPGQVGKAPNAPRKDNSPPGMQQ